MLGILTYFYRNCARTGRIAVGCSYVRVNFFLWGAGKTRLFAVCSEDFSEKRLREALTAIGHGMKIEEILKKSRYVKQNGRSELEYRFFLGAGKFFFVFRGRKREKKEKGVGF